MRIHVDPNTDSSGFDYAEPAKYMLRVTKVEEKKKAGGEYPYLNWSFEFADANVKGVQGKKCGNIFDITTLKKGENAQFRLKQLCDALGVVWGDFDTEATIGLEFMAEVGTDVYNNVISNKISKYIPKA